MKHEKRTLFVHASWGPLSAGLYEVVQPDGNHSYQTEICREGKVLWDGDAVEAWGFVRLAQRCMDVIEQLGERDYHTTVRARELYRRCRILGYYSPTDEGQYQHEDDRAPLWGK